MNDTDPFTSRVLRMVNKLISVFKPTEKVRYAPPTATATQDDEQGGAMTDVGRTWHDMTATPRRREETMTDVVPGMTYPILQPTGRLDDWY
jgi:hypothetical protein